VVLQEDDMFTIRGRVWCGDRTILTGTGIFKVIEQRTDYERNRPYRA